MTAHIPSQYACLLDPSVTEVVEGSGRSSAKSTTNEVLIVLMMMRACVNNVWYCRAEGESLGKSIVSSLWSTIQLLGVERHFTMRLSPFEVTCKLTGAKCYFTGINGKTEDDTTKTKGFTPQNKTLCLAVLDEADQVKHPNHITAWETTANKFLMPTGKFIYAHNPPINRSHWAYKFFADKVKNGAAKVVVNWQDVRGLLKPRTIADILKMKRDDPEFYRYWYLGEPINFRGLVYPQFDRKRHIIDIDHLFAQRDRVTELVLGLDEGTVNDSTCVTALAIMQSGRAVVLDCLEIDPLKIGQQSPTQQSRRLYAYLESLLKRFDFLKAVPRKWIFECAEGGQMIKLQFECDYGESCCLVGKKSIMGDIKRVRSLLSDNILFFHKRNGTHSNIMQLVDDIENYIFDERTGDIKKNQRDDTIDSLEYATKLYYDTPLMVQ